MQTNISSQPLLPIHSPYVNFYFDSLCLMFHALFSLTKLTTTCMAHQGPSNNAYPVPPGPGSYVPSAPSQVGQYSNPMMSQVAAPGAGPIGFTPMPTPGVAPRSVIGSVQPASPPAPQAAPAPAAPPPTVQTADTSNVAGIVQHHICFVSHFKKPNGHLL